MRPLSKGIARVVKPIFWRERAQVIHEPREHACLVEDRRQMLRICGVNTVEQRLQISLHDRKWGPQLVRDVR